MTNSPKNLYGCAPRFAGGFSFSSYTRLHRGPPGQAGGTRLPQSGNNTHVNALSNFKAVGLFNIHGDLT
jgi:hypothetical protein